MPNAEAYFRRALALRDGLSLLQYMVEDQAGLAGVMLDRGELAVAREFLHPVLTYLTENPALNGAEHPYQVFLVCGQVLQANL